MINNKTLSELKTKEKPYKYGIGKGLFLYIRSSGTKVWRLKYYFGGKEKSLTIGKFPYISLNEAKIKCEEAKTLLEKDYDPSMKKSLKKTHKKNWKPKIKCGCERCHYYWLGFKDNKSGKDFKDHLIELLNKYKKELGTIFIKKVVLMLKKG